VVAAPTLLALEEASWHALCSDQGAEFFQRLLTPDATMVVPGGGPLARDLVLQAIAATPPWTWFRLEEPRVQAITADCALVSYRATAQREGLPAYTAWMTSVYRNRAGTWQLAFHQQTPA
jgi:hypothetical protein